MASSRVVGSAVAFVVLAAASAMASDWPDFETSWLPADDAFVWPELATKVRFESVPARELDVDLDGKLLSSLERPPTAGRLLAARLDLDGDGAFEVLYVEEATSGTGGRNIRIVERTNEGPTWIADLLCAELHVLRHRRDGWSSLACLARRGTEYQRVLFVRCDGRYRSARHEVHDLEDEALRLRPVECPSTD
jgi:hypothetical protein